MTAGEIIEVEEESASDQGQDGWYGSLDWGYPAVSGWSHRGISSTPVHTPSRQC
mgnify:CR=1 FL=1